ncbi:MAG: acyl-CoA dehydrogenase family protein [Actinobacteria bacterium]|nr:acyl-CoA dehydrogenase family protein [Actinomycetota bacterium]
MCLCPYDTSCPPAELRKPRPSACTINRVTTATTDAYAIPPELGDLRDMIRQLAQEKIAPRAAEIDRTGQYPRDVRELLAEHDVLGLPFEEQYGGTGTGTLMLQMAVEQIAAACASSALILMVQELGTLPIQLFGTDEQKERFLPRCASGEWSPAFALSEPVRFEVVP